MLIADCYVAGSFGRPLAAVVEIGEIVFIPDIAQPAVASGLLLRGTAFTAGAKK